MDKFNKKASKINGFLNLTRWTSSSQKMDKFSFELDQVDKFKMAHS